MPEPTPSLDSEPAPDDIVANVVDTPDGAQCTLFPANADPDDLVTRWITAEEDAFVALSDVR